MRVTSLPSPSGRATRVREKESRAHLSTHPRGKPKEEDAGAADEHHDVTVVDTELGEHDPADQD